MKNQRLNVYIIAFALILMVVSTTSVFATERDVKWDVISENLVNALRSDNAGLQQSAMRLIIQYAEHVKVDDGVLNLMRLYRHSDNSKVRQLALVTLHKIGNDYAMDFVKRNLKFETDEKIIKISNAILYNYKEYAAVDGGVEIAAR